MISIYIEQATCICLEDGSWGEQKLVGDEGTGRTLFLLWKSSWLGVGLERFFKGECRQRLEEKEKHDLAGKIRDDILGREREKEGERKQEIVLEIKLVGLSG